jgi:hypothetical protein
MHAPPSPWLLAGIALGGLTVAGLFLVQALRQAVVLP